MENMENNNGGMKSSMPSFKKMDSDLSVAILGLVVAILPGIVAKFYAFSSATTTTPPALVSSPSFNAATVIIAFILGLYAMAKARDNHAIRTIALLTVIVCLLRFLLQA